jgi:hypothetical protein
MNNNQLTGKNTKHIKSEKKTTSAKNNENI